MREAILYDRLKGARVRCRLCHRRCLIGEGDTGWCGTRLNEGGTLYTLAYGNLSSMESRPIEIKPFFHYWPGSRAMTFSTWSCNFDCPWCQNHSISRRRPARQDPVVPPEHLLRAALAHGDRALCASFQEPTLQTGYAADLFSQGRARGLYSCYVSNGYMTPGALTLLANSGMDGIKIDLKGPPEVYEGHCGGVEVGHVLRNMELAVELGVHLEVVNLVVTGVNDDPSSIEWVIERHLEHAGPLVPLHFTRYHPDYRYDRPSPPVCVLERAAEAARRRGILYAYLGNVGRHRMENTYCPQCGTLLIERRDYRVISSSLKDDHRCPSCGTEIPIRGRLVGGS